MLTKTYIEYSLKSINESDFQNLIIRFLMFKGYKYLSAPGAMNGKNKTKKGTPDALFHGLDRNKYVLCEITTKNKKDSKTKFMDKLKEDIDHCFDYKKTKIKNTKVDEVILACNSSIDLNEYDELKEYIKENYQNENLRIYSIQNLAEELVSFPDIDEFFPNIALYDGISTLDGFIENSEKGIRPDLKNKYLKDEENFNILNSVLKDEDILLIYGIQGIGKTRLSIELAKEFSAENKYNVLIINYYDNNLKNNLYKIIKEKQNYIIIFDNYTDYKTIDYLINRIQQIHNKSKFKFIFTLRKPYLNNLKIKLSDFKIHEIQISEVSYEFMKNFINQLSKDYGFAIKKNYIDQIINLSKRNIGFVLMILLPLFENNDYSYLKNPQKAYENYFNNYKSFDAILSNDDYLKILGIMSFFDKIDLNDNTLISKILKIFKIDLNDNNNIIHELCKYELLTKNNNLLEFSDSILSTYLFYYTFISKNILCFEDLIINFIKSYNVLINNKIYETILAFGFEDFKNKKYQTLLKIEYQLKNEELISFYNIFHIYFEIQILNFVKTCLDEEPEEYFDKNKFKIPDVHNYFSKNRLIKLLTKLITTEYYLFALKLFIEIIYEKPSLTKEVFYNLKEKYSYDIYSFQHGYIYQNNLMEFIETEFEDENKEIIKKTLFIFLLNENRLFDWHHVEFHQITNHEVNINRFKLPITTDLSEFRLRLLNYLLKIYDEYNFDVERNLYSYMRLMTPKYSELIFDEEITMKKLFGKMDFNRYYPNKLAYTYYNKLTGLYYDKFKWYNNNFPDFYEYNHVNHINKINLLSKITQDYEDFDLDEKIPKIENYLKENHNYIEFFDLLTEIKEYEDWYFNIDYLFVALIRFDKELFIEAFDYYCLNNYNLLKSFGFITELLENTDLNALKIYDLLNRNSYDELESCNNVFFKVIPKNEITEEIFYKLIKHVKTSKRFNFLPQFYIEYEYIFNKLKKKLNTKTTNIVQFLTEIVINKKENYKYTFSHDFCKEFENYFKDNFELLKNTYFKRLTLNFNFDHKFEELEILCKINKSFINEYFEWRFENHNTFYEDDYQMNFIWNLNYNFKELTLLIENIINNSKDFNCEGVSLLFTGKHLKEREFIIEFIKNNYDNEKLIKILFINIKKFYSHEEYINFMEIQLLLNNNYEIFESIIQPNFYIRELFSEEGDIKLRLDFYNKLKTELFNLNSLDYIKHMELIENKINKVEQELQNYYKYSQ